MGGLSIASNTFTSDDNGLQKRLDSTYENPGAGIVGSSVAVGLRVANYLEGDINEGDGTVSHHLGLFAICKGQNIDTAPASTGNGTHLKALNGQLIWDGDAYTLPLGYGGEYNVQCDSGTITEAAGIYLPAPLAASILSGGNITTYYGLWLKGLNGTTDDQVGTAYGLWLDGDGSTAGLCLGADNDINMYFDGTDLRVDGLSLDAGTVSADGTIQVNIGGTVVHLLYSTTAAA